MITLKSEDAYIRIIPERGAIVSEYGVGDHSILYMDDEMNLQSPIIRGGIPILFPICGSLQKERYYLEQNQYYMPKHGFARDQAWNVIKIKENTATFQLKSNELTRKYFPFEFILTVSYELTPLKLYIYTQIQNLSDKIMPYQLGFHPYFLVDDKKSARIVVSSNEIRSFSNQIISEIGLEAVTLKIDGEEIHLQCSYPLNHFVLWTLEDKKFICVEPWTGAPGDFEKGKMNWLAPRESVNTTFSICPEFRK